MIGHKIRILIAIAIALWSEATLADGQCTVSNREDSSSSSDENIRKRLEEHDRKLQTMHEALSSAFEKLNELNVLLDQVNGSIMHTEYQG